MPKLSIIIPCYNEGKCIKENIENKVLPFLKENNIDFELILVNDGSKDNTGEIISLMKDIIPVSYFPNKGKGGAVQAGIAKASGEYVLFMDADLSTDLSAINTVYANLDKYDFIIGSRHLKESVLPQKQPLFRQFVGWCCRKLVNMNFHFNYKDTQCGFKAIRTSIAKDLIKKQIIFGFAFDVEYLYYAKLHNYSTLEIPVTWINDTSSTVRVASASKQFLKDMHKMKKNKQNYLKEL